MPEQKQPLAEFRFTHMGMEQVVTINDINGEMTTKIMTRPTGDSGDDFKANVTMEREEEVIDNRSLNKDGKRKLKKNVCWIVTSLKEKDQPLEPE